MLWVSCSPLRPQTRTTQALRPTGPFAPPWGRVHVSCLKTPIGKQGESTGGHAWAVRSRHPRWGTATSRPPPLGERSSMGDIWAACGG